MSSVISRGSGRSSQSDAHHDYSVAVLDLSKKKIAVIKDLSFFTRLQILDLSNNNLESVDGIDCCRELWYINLSNNKIKCLNGFSDFVALGTLALANNLLTWRALAAIQHLHVVHLVLQGNAAVCADKFYREHVLDSLPHVWILDGRYISSCERTENQQFFQRSALGQNPVRHKMRKQKFVPSFRKDAHARRVFGRKATELMIHFPVQAAHNVDMDKRRIKYIGRLFEADIGIFAEHSKKDQRIFHDSPSFLLDLVELQDAQPDLKDVCNMLTLLLLCSLEFAIPTHLLKETLDTMKLSSFGTLSTLNLFLLPKEVRCVVVQTLFACATLSFHTKTSALEEHLFVAMQSSITELTKISVTFAGDEKYLALSKLDRAGLSSYRSLLASELVYQMCLVPYFYDVLTELSVVYLLSMASGDLTLADRLVGILRREQERGEEPAVIYDILSAVICRAVNKHVAFLLRRLNKGAQRAVRDQLPVARPEPKPLFSSAFLTSGRTPPDQRPASVLATEPHRMPELGDEVLVGAQNIARVIAVPDSQLVQVQMQQVPVPNGGMSCVPGRQGEHFAYVDARELEWDAARRRWKPRGAVGDKITFQLEVQEAGPADAEAPGGRPEAQPTPRPLSAVMLQHHPAEMVRLFERTGERQFLEEISRSLQELRIPAGRNSPTDAAGEQVDGDMDGASSCGKTDVTSERSNLPTIRETTPNSERSESGSKTVDKNSDDLNTTDKENASHTKQTTAAEKFLKKEMKSQLIDDLPVKALTPESPRPVDSRSVSRAGPPNSGRNRFLSAGSSDSAPQVYNTSITEIKVPNLTSTRLPNDLPYPRVNVDSYRHIGRNLFFDENVSAYQRQRAEAWRAKAYTGAETPKNEDLFRPKRGFRLARQEAGQWLGNGRDLFAEEQLKRTAPGYCPGWKQSLATVSARRSMRRGETPVINTPSSLLYDCYCRHPPTQVVCGDEQQIHELQIPVSTPMAPPPSCERRTRRPANGLSPTQFGAMCFDCQTKDTRLYQ